MDEIKLVELSPKYGRGTLVVFLAGATGGQPTIWQSTNNGQTFKRRSAPLTVDAWTVVNDDTLFVGSFDGSNGLVYYSTNGGWTFSDGVVVGSQQLNAVLLSPNYEEDKTILAGNANGWVYWSDDNGASFWPLPADATSPPLSGLITIAFDPEYDDNGIVYAASDTADEGIYRLAIDKDTDWESVDDTLPSAGIVSGLAVSADGVLYASNAKANGGMERSLNPTYSLGPTFATVTRGLETGATLSGLWLCGNEFWSIDSINNRLMTFTDSLSQPVTLVSPADGAPGTGTLMSSGKVSNITLDWEAAGGATEYQWQVDSDTEFSNVPSDLDGTTKSSSVRLPSLETAARYYWRVKASQPVTSPWSGKWSFTTTIGGETIAPVLSTPEAGAVGVPTSPIFQWSTIADASRYELLVSTDAAFGNPTVAKLGDYALPSTAWQCNINLNYDTTYYWKVRAIGSGTQSAWSAVGAFNTESPPADKEPLTITPTPQTVTSPPSSPPIVQPAIPEWIVYLMGALLLTIILLLIIVLLLVVGIRRL